MELGALICTPGTPDCERCPIAGHCRAQASGTAALRPLRSRRRPPRLLPLLAAGLALPDGRLLLVQSPTRGLFGGLWSFPMLPRGRETERRLQKQLGIEIRLQEKLAELDHFLTHRHLSVWLFRGALSGPELSLSGYQGHCFVAPGAAPTDLGLSSLARKLWRIATDK